MADVTISRNRDRSRYEAEIEGRAAGFADYSEEEGVVVMPHTEVFPEFEGQGVGGALVRRALDDVRAAGFTVDPVCPFVAGWIEKHPDYQDLVTGPR
ncbi:MAG: GNAT family N-acetyltransferase [Brachybacterium sp.]|nr:GNAT family N-acetyltransferase [Brachybacterium sp.]